MLYSHPIDVWFIITLHSVKLIKPCDNMLTPLSVVVLQEESVKEITQKSLKTTLNAYSFS